MTHWLFDSLTSDVLVASTMAASHKLMTISAWLICGLTVASWTVSAETITAGKDHTCMIQTDDTVICWGKQ